MFIRPLIAQPASGCPASGCPGTACRAVSETAVLNILDIQNMPSQHLEKSCTSCSMHEKPGGSWDTSTCSSRLRASRVDQDPRRDRQPEILRSRTCRQSPGSVLADTVRSEDSAAPRPANPRTARNLPVCRCHKVELRLAGLVGVHQCTRPGSESRPGSATAPPRLQRLPVSAPRPMTNSSRTSRTIVGTCCTPSSPLNEMYIMKLVTAPIHSNFRSELLQFVTITFLWGCCIREWGPISPARRLATLLN